MTHALRGSFKKKLHILGPPHPGSVCVSLSSIDLLWFIGGTQRAWIRITFIKIFPEGAYPGPPKLGWDHSQSSHNQGLQLRAPVNANAWSFRLELLVRAITHTIDFLPVKRTFTIFQPKRCISGQFGRVNSPLWLPNCPEMHRSGWKKVKVR